ncbi:xanthine dehydrogenase family protein molybdopterin-binding subunit [Erythrobacter sp. YT30]|uniref:xanthine dehydrogenase family protein molybdopterin-binding subunit n=1 Tax=Erythrobacter sp. YT30 TaxID=1735012 RepID=UPI00076C4235|nr:xanthine dehydrogenase family protein molybdopterin-binding subunit [Erythrobacter sp. YT30]KWV91063.1 hypothetical protein AUC45_07025 [Erythrobacter sp. YT30]
MTEQTRVIGKPVSRIDGVLKTTGGAHYSGDRKSSDGALLHGVLVKSTVAAGYIAGFDTAEAKQMPGFVRFLSYEDGDLIYRIDAPNDDSFVVNEQRTPFIDNQVHFVGQHIGLALAETLEVAEAAAAAILVEYEEDSRHIALDDEDSDLDKPDASGTGEALQVHRGDFDEGLADADVSVSATYTTPVEHHNPIEPSATTAVWDGDRLTVYDATQGNVNDRNYLAAGTGLAKDQVRVLNPFIGGGFGCKGYAWPHSLIAAAAARATGRPVRLVLSRSDMYTSCGHRPQTRQSITLAAKSDGTFTALKHETLSHRSPIGDHMEPCGMPSMVLYDCPNLVVTHSNRVLNRPSPTPMRGPGEASGAFALESAVDELAEKLGIDPVELRKRNASQMDPRNSRPWSTFNHPECLDRGAERIGWSRRKSPGQWREGNELVGLGVATTYYPAYRSPAAARVTLFPDETAKVEISVQDIGTGLYTILAQMVAEKLGLEAADVAVEIGDTDLPEGPLAGGSMTTASVSGGVAAACDALQEKRAQASGDEAISAEAGSEESLGFGGDNDMGKSFLSFGAIFAEVRVDKDFGIVRIPRLVGVFDAGKILNPKTARSQMIGGMIFGVGMAMLEETFVDPESGRFINPSLGEYYVPVNADIHDIDVEFIDEPDYDFNPFGARGIGELGTVGTAPAIANAVYNATGIRVRDLPIRLDDLM